MKNTYFFKTLMLLLAGMFITGIILAQIPQAINYQAVARNASGQVISESPIGGKFVIRSNNQSGTIVYEETFTAQTNAFGTFTAKIGQGTPTSGNFASIAWDDYNTFLEVWLDVSGGTNYQLLSQSQFITVPYAMAARRITDPSSINLGDLGNVEGQPTNGQLLQWNGSAWVPATVNAGTNGVDGRTILNGTSNPASGQGAIGDFFINTTTDQIFGPKTAGGWGNGTSLIGPAGPQGQQGVAGATGATGPQGPAGAQGTQGQTGATGATGPQGPIGLTGPAGPQGATGPAGAAGTNGTNGKTVLNGTTAPASALGTVGDFYINTATNQLFGPKTAGGWGNGVSLVGPAGATGATGATGPQGPAGPQGAQGQTGAAGPQGATGPAGAAGTNGTNGKTVLNGTTAPASGIGTNGDFYINTATSTIFGPKTAGGWGSGTSLVGPQGPAGPGANISGTTNFIPKFTNATSLGNSRLIETTNNHGFNITNPSSRLHLHSTATLTDFQITNSNSGTTVTDGLALYLTSSEAHINQQENSSLIFSTNGSPRVYINNVGNVGMGTPTIPSESRLVVGALNTTNEGGQIQLNAPGGSFTTAYHIDNFENRFRVMSGTNTGSSTTRFAISNTGNVGIGTEGPNSKLHIVAGAANALEIEGGIRVSGSAANRAAFNVAPVSTNTQCISCLTEFQYWELTLNHPQCNNNPNCLIFITVVQNGFTGATSIRYDNPTGRWKIRTDYNLLGEFPPTFNVLIIGN